MSKNHKGRAPRSKGTGRRAWKATLHLDIIGCSASYYMTGVPLYTPVYHSIEGGKKITRHVMPERQTRKAQARYLSRIQAGLVMFEDDGERKGTCKNIIRELNMRGIHQQATAQPQIE